MVNANARYVRTSLKMIEEVVCSCMIDVSSKYSKTLFENMVDKNVRFISGNGEIIKVKICGNENVSC